MSSLAIFFIVAITVVTKNVYGSITVQDLDVDSFLDLINQNKINRQDADSDSVSDSDESNSSNDVARLGRLGADNLMDIISLAVNNKNIKQANNDRKNRKSSHRERIQKYENRNSRYDNYSQRTFNVADLLEQLINKGLKDDESKSLPNTKTSKKRVAPNRLLGDEKPKNPDDLDEYSKIYILLNPEAIQKSKSSSSSINKLISKVLSLSSSPLQRQPVKPKQKRYKGFAIKEQIDRRRGRDSREMYAPKDSDEEKPLRSRGGGGGGAGGHTAIPYIRHRGENIYEKDN